MTSSHERDAQPLAIALIFHYILSTLVTVIMLKIIPLIYIFLIVSNGRKIDDEDAAIYLWIIEFVAPILKTATLENAAKPRVKSRGTKNRRWLSHASSTVLYNPLVNLTDVYRYIKYSTADTVHQFALREWRTLKILLFLYSFCRSLSETAYEKRKDE